MTSKKSGIADPARVSAAKRAALLAELSSDEFTDRLTAHMESATKAAVKRDTEALERLTCTNRRLADVRGQRAPGVDRVGAGGVSGRGKARGSKTIGLKKR